jgi:signal transduction histidine kinase/DNA-binding response OmpR family regulator/streptogramin lyase
LPQAFVPAIVQDPQGFIWMATRDGLARYDGRQFRVFQPGADDRPAIASAEVAQVRLDPAGKLWVASGAGQLDVVDPRTEQITDFTAQPVYQSSKASAIPSTLFCVDRRGRLWMECRQGGLLSVDPATGRVRRYQHQPTQPQSIRDNRVVAVQPDARGTIWVLTQAGLDALEESSGQFRHYQLPIRLPPKGLWVRPGGQVLVAADNALVVLHPAAGTVRTYPLPPPTHPVSFVHFAEDPTGTVYFARHTALFSFTEQQGPFQLDAGTNRGTDAYLSALVDHSGVLWLGTAGAGVRTYDLRALPFQTRPYRQNFLLDLLTQGWISPLVRPVPPPVRALSSYNFRYTVDGPGRLWYNAGSSDIYRLDRQTGRSERVPFPVPFRNETIGMASCPLTTDPRGRVWAVFGATAYGYDEASGRWNRFPFPLSLAPGNVVQMFTVDETALWLATATGGLIRVDRATGRQTAFTHVRHQPASLPGNTLLCLATDPDEATILWVGTFGSGLGRFDKKTGRTQRFSTANGLPNNVVYSVLPDRQGTLWLGTNKGIGRLDRRSRRTRTYTTQDGILADEFNRFHFLHLPPLPGQPDQAERIVLGGLEGITAFYPSRIKPDTFAPRVELTALYVNNKPVVPGPDSPLGTLPIQAVQTLDLPYSENFVSLDFAALQFNRTGKNQYRYQLVGLDPDWVESRRPEAVFTGLQPGDYTLRLNASNVSGRWSPSVRTLSIRIRPPWWATGWAYAWYALAGLGIGYWLVRNYTNRLQLRQSIARQQQETGQLRELNELKTRFFANITHEFRTPLTLMLGPLEQLTGESLEPRIHRRLGTIEQQAQQLLRLTNQLLDLSRLEGGMMPVHPSRGELSACVAHWLEPLMDQATAQGISLTVQSDLPGSYWFDVAQFERIVVNLTANALKFTPAGAVTVALTDAPAGIVLSVTDTGIGIPAAQLPHLFERFYQVPPSGERSRGGTGIGLALVSELVQLHQGSITVESTLGQGTRFVVTLPYPKAASEPPAQLPPPAGTAEWPGSPPTDFDDVRILLVEDNDELADFIGDSLPATYQLGRAVDGQAGLAQALAELPDLIIADVMMPRMDGFALCQALKTDLRTSHIPLILLTAKATVDDRLEGLSRGADDYLTKPFLVAELRLRVQNQLAQRQRQRAWLARQLTTAGETMAGEAGAPQDPFLTRLYALLDAQLANPALNVDQLAGELAMSRTTLHRKLKALSVFSTNELIRHYRLKAAAGLLAQGHTSAETAERVGFENLSYFAKAFREVYGVAPTEFARAHPATPGNQG